MPQTQVISSPLPLNSSTEKILQKNPKELPFGGRIRYNIFINLIVIVIAGLPFFVPTYITMGMNAFYCFSWVVFVTLAGITQYKIRNYLKTFDSSKLPENVTKTKLIMATFVYKEPLDLILTALKNLSEQKIASEIIMAVCMEERTPEKENKISKILSEFSNTFSRLIITVHPYGTEGEIPGKCSNSNYALRSIVQELQAQTEDFKPEDYVVTNFDVDTRFHPRFLEMVQRVTSEEKDRNNVVWQPVLYYNWGLDKLAFFTRMTGLVRNIFMMGALIPFNINIMSVYTASLKLYIDGDYCHPGYQMDDIICYIRWLTLTKRSLTIKPIYCPTISGPTSGKNMIHEFAEWARQGRRWSIGSAEVFHYFCIKAKRIGFVTAFTWAINYLNYYAGFLCAQTFLMITTTIVISLEPANTLIPQLYFLIPLGVVYSCLLMVMVLNKYALATYLKELNVVEKIPFYKDVIHWISGLFVMIGYSFVVAYGFCEIIFQGKKVCKHGASSKANLVAKKAAAAKVDEVQIEIAGL